MVLEDLLGVRRTINLAGPLTRLGGMPLSPAVIEAMAAAGRSNYRVEDVQEAAGRYLAEICGAEAGYVTAGAAAGLTLAAAACMAGLDVAAMDRLPHAEGLRNEIVVQRGHLTAHSHALRLAGVTLVEAGYDGYPGQGITWRWQVEAAINERTAALFYSIGSARGIISLPELSEIGRSYELPLIVDAAAALPPKENLRRLIADGADLVAFSGGKAIGGPQASGILVGRHDLIESVALQHQDMDVYPDTWTWRERYLATAKLPGPPHHGIGRPMKVGKEEIAGLVAALREFLEQDVEAERARQVERLRRIAERVESKSDARVEMLDEASAPRAYPTLVIYPLGGHVPETIASIINRLVEGEPSVSVSQNFWDVGAIGVIASTLRDDDVESAAERIADELRAASQNR
jgi:D-glucosaminate-6-phosphate ammonia-lyase